MGAFLLGVAVWLVLRGEPSPDPKQPEEAARFPQRLDSAARASAWVDATLTKLRADGAAAERENTRAATMEEFLGENRKDSEKWWRERNEEIDRIVRDARSMRGISYPAAALRAAQTGDAGNLKELAIFLHWLETDPDAALAEMGRNWHLLEREYLPALLERKFGIDWMSAKIADEEAPYRLRTALARELGREAAQGQGLAGLLGYYNSIPDPRLKILMAWDFVNEWPIEDSREVARFLLGNVPKELRELLMENWKYLPYGENSWEEVWVRDLLEELGMDASSYVVFSPGMEYGMDLEAVLKRQEARKSMALDEVVRDCIKEGSSPQDAVGEAIRTKLHDALADGRNLIEMFWEGHLSRDELLIQAFTPGNIHGDPRIQLRLARYRAVTQGLKEDRPRDRILNQAAYEWIRWQAVSPVDAETWMKTLPQDEPVYAEIRAREALERRRKENR